MNQAVVRYLSPKGRQMSRDVLGRSYAEILIEARRIANRPNITRVQVFSVGGRLLSRVGKTERSKG